MFSRLVTTMLNVKERLCSKIKAVLHRRIQCKHDPLTHWLLRVSAHEKWNTASACVDPVLGPDLTTTASRPTPPLSKRLIKSKIISMFALLYRLYTFDPPSSIHFFILLVESLLSNAFKFDSIAVVNNDAFKIQHLKFVPCWIVKRTLHFCILVTFSSLLQCVFLITNEQANKHTNTCEWINDQRRKSWWLWKLRNL